jgi:hypothetical protein
VKDEEGLTLPSYCFVLFIFCVVLCIVCFVAFPVFFVCICVPNNCHRVATQLQLNISYHMVIFKQLRDSASQEKFCCLQCV